MAVDCKPNDEELIKVTGGLADTDIPGLEKIGPYAVDFSEPRARFVVQSKGGEKPEPIEHP